MISLHFSAADIFKYVVKCTELNYQKAEAVVYTHSQETRYLYHKTIRIWTELMSMNLDLISAPQTLLQSVYNLFTLTCSATTSFYCYVVFSLSIFQSSAFNLNLQISRATNKRESYSGHSVRVLSARKPLPFFSLLLLIWRYQMANAKLRLKS